MSSNLKVNTILPSVGSNIGIGTNGGELNVDGGCKVQVGTALTLGHSIGLQYATQNLHSAGFEINQINASGIITASHFYGNGANLSGITQTTINNNANNRLITGSGTANTLEGEANLTWDGNDLSLSGTAPAINFIDTDSDDYKIHNVQGVLKITDTTASADRFVINDNGTGYFVNNFQIGSTTTSPGATLHIKSSYPSLKIDDGNNNTNAYIGIIAGTGKESNINFGDPADADHSQISYDHNGDHMKFKIGGSEKFRVNSNGLCIGGTGSSNALDDYEEGSWNPLWSNSASNSGGTTTSNNMYGKYTKIGRIVHAYFYTWGLPAGNSGSMYLQGFPFQCNGDPGTFFCAVQSAFYNFGADNYYNLGLRLSTNRTFAELIFCRKDPGNYIAANFSGFINYYTNFQGVMTYEVA